MLVEHGMKHFGQPYGYTQVKDNKTTSILWPFFAIFSEKIYEANVIRASSICNFTYLHLTCTAQKMKFSIKGSCGFGHIY